MNLTFKAITLNDLPQLMPIENACHSHPWSEKLFGSCIGGNYFGDLLTVNSQVVGFYVAQFVAGEATLMDICVSPIEQGQGFGKKLLLKFFEQAETKGSTELFLEVRASNITAQMLYINQGFTEIGRRTGYYPSAKGFGYEDAIMMKR